MRCSVWPGTLTSPKQSRYRSGPALSPPWAAASDRAVHRTIHRCLIVTRWSIGAAYAFAATMSIAAILTAFLPRRNPEPSATAIGNSSRQRSVISVLAEHRRILLTLGIGILVISAARATRQSIVPLWAESVGIDDRGDLRDLRRSGHPAVLSGGAIMDRFRVYVAVPTTIVLGLGFMLLPLTTGPLASAWWLR